MENAWLDPIRQGVRQIAQSTLSRGPNPEKLNGLVRKVDLITDSEIAKAHAAAAQRGLVPDCGKGCCHCCYQTVWVALLEVGRIVTYISENFSEDERTALAKRAAFRKRGEACPLLVNGECSAYEARPLFCRGWNSTDVQACIVRREAVKPVEIPQIPGQIDVAGAVSIELRAALADFGYMAEPVELGQTLAQVLNPSDEPSGSFSAKDPAMLEYRDLLYEQGKTEDAIEVLKKGTHAGHLLRRASVPVAYESEDEILEWRQRFLRTIREIKDSKFDPKEAFDGLDWFFTFELAYQGLDVREALEEVGDLVCNRITARALPDLCSPLETRKRSGKIRLGYIGNQIKGSNATNWALGWLAHHGEDIERFVFNVGPVEDATSDEFARAADHYYHMPGHVAQAGRFIKSLDLDALIYPAIGMGGRDYQFASMRLAPIQCTGWGHPVTSGLPTIDYYLSSELMESPDGDSHYSERLIRLPGSGLCYPRRKYDAAPGHHKRVPFLMAQNLMKCVPRWDFLFDEIAARSGKPVTVLEGIKPAETAIVKRRLERARIPVEWLPRQTSAEYRRLLASAGVSIDPPAWNGGNTTIDALALGTPVVTLPTQFMRGRHSLAFLKIAGAPGLVAKDAADYVDLCLDEGRRAEAMEGLNVDALFEDRRPVEALDDFLRASV